MRCYVLERTYSKPGTRTEEIVSPRQGYLLLRTTWSRRRKPYHIHSLFDVHQVVPGRWAPGRIVEESRSVHDDGAEQLDRRTESRVVRYEPEKTINIAGTVAEFQFVNPHVLVYVEAKGADGKDVKWGGELTSPNRLARLGGPVKWHKDILKPGGEAPVEEEEVAGSPDYDEDHPDEADYQPFPILPFMSDTPIASMDMTDEHSEFSLAKVHLMFAEPKEMLAGARPVSEALVSVT